MGMKSLSKQREQNPEEPQAYAYGHSDDEDESRSAGSQNEDSDSTLSMDSMAEEASPPSSPEAHAKPSAMDILAMFATSVRQGASDDEASGGPQASTWGQSCTQAVRLPPVTSLGLGPFHPTLMCPLQTATWPERS